MEITIEQDLIYQGKLCPYCKKEPEFVNSEIVYGKDYGMIYYCKDCGAWCGVHEGTELALGRLANKELRKIKIEAHDHFDKLWKDGHFKRNEVYKMLSKYLGIPRKYTHIGMFSVKTCKAVIEYAKMILGDMERLDKDFGANG